MISSLATNWWAVMIRGILGIGAGIITFLWPGITLAGLVILFGAYALLTGILSITGAIKAVHRHDRWVALVFEGIAGLIASAVTVVWPATTLFALVYVIAAWALIIGALEIAAAIKLRKQVRGEWLLALSGGLSIAFAFLIAIAPLAGALVIALWFGAYSLVFGIILIALGLRLRSWRRTLVSGTGPSSMPLPAH